MPNTILHKRGTTVPGSASLVTGELAINTATGQLYTKNDAGTVVEIGASSSPTWGTISGTLSSQTDLQSALDLKANLSGATYTGKVTTVLSATSGAGFNLPPGAAPSAPVNGDVWSTTTGLFARINGSSQQVAMLGFTNTWTSGQTFTTASLTLGNSTAASTYNLGTGATISGATKTINIGTAGVSGSTTNINIGTTTGTATATVNALLVSRASAATGAGFRISPGTAPSSPVNGDVWLDAAGMYARINGATVTMSPPSAATVAEAKLGNDTAKFISANVLQKVINSPSYYKFPRGVMSTATSGTGASVTAGALITWLTGTTTGAGWAQHKYYGFSGVDIINATGWAVGAQSINFAKQFRITGATNLFGPMATNTIVRVMFGKGANDAGGDPTSRCIGWRYNQATGFIEIIAHNGTSLSTFTTASNPASGGWFEWELYNNGSGTVQMFVNDVSIGTVTGGPVSLDFASAPTYVEEIQTTATPSAQPSVRFRNGGLFLQP